MRPSLLDTDTLSEIIKGRHPLVAQRSREYLAQFGAFSFSLITRYEILRGLKARNAEVQIGTFERQCRQSHVLPVSDDIIVQAADMYAYLRQQGQLISDADLLVAATALVHGLELVTNNMGHYRRLPGLSIVSWNA